ncbi:MAG: outer membrane protein assembly factor BamA [Candidatus Marinimicrobia bacterium]|nr:outer membrane protein assembly factor BamA [Candidatus Neomarinimicrobiota bacterium]
MVFKTGITLIFLLATLAWGQPVPSFSLKEVVVEGSERASQQVIRSTSRLIPGRTVTGLDIQRGIRRLWDLGFFADVQVYMDDETDEGLVLRITVEEYPSLEEIIFEGNKKISKNKLLEAIEFKPPQILSEYAVSEVVRKVKAAYHEDGFLKVEVAVDQLPGERPHGQKLVISIKEHKRVRLKHIRIEGNDNVATWLIRLKMKNTKRWRWYTFWRSPFNQDEYEEDIKSVLDYYRNQGYRDVMIASDSVGYAPDGKSMELVLRISEGHPYYYRNFSWEGNTLHTDEKLQAALGFSTGDLVNKEAFAMAVAQKVHPVYMDEGYLYSRVEPVEYPVGMDSVDVVFNIVEGKKVSIRYINISGNEKTRDYVIRRELRIDPGDTFSYERLGRSQRDVWILNFFENVEPDVQPVDEDEVDLDIKVTERSTDRANLSIGYTEQFGIIGGGGLEFNNLLGTGQLLNLNYTRGAQNSLGLSSGVRQSAYQSISVSLMNPWLLNTPNLVGLSVFYSERGRSQAAAFYLPFDIIQIGGSARWGRRFRWPDSFFRGSWSFQAANKSYSLDDPSQSLEERRQLLKSYLSGVTDDEFPEGEAYISTIGISLTQAISRDSRDRPEFPTRGSELNWVSTLSGLWLGGNEDFHKHVFTLKWYVPATQKLVFHQSLKLGAIKQVTSRGDRSILPPDERFYMGGTGIPFGEMLRGYQDNTVGPYLDRPLGGTVMLKYSAELRLSLSNSPTVYALAFVDMGNTWLDFGSVDPFLLKRSAGVGVRIFMPMLGLLGLDLGYGFDPVDSDRVRSPNRDPGPHGWEFHFIFGAPF